MMEEATTRRRTIQQKPIKIEKTQALLVIGVLPEPIGGVSIHVKRLLENLEETHIAADFLKTHDLLRFQNVKLFLGHKNVHIHASRPFVRAGLAMLCFLLRKNSFFTYHGNLGRFTGIKNVADRLAIRLFKVPIMINRESYEKAIQLNKNTQLTSAFFPPRKIEPLNNDIQEAFSKLKSSTDTVFATNASYASIDKNGLEIYQGTELVKIFNEMPSKGLIVSDPSGSYKKWFDRKGVKLNSNILLLPFPHDFVSIIKQSDVVIRFTTTDGDPLSVKEALLLKKPVIATDVVDRPKEVTLIPRDGLILKDLIASTSIWPSPSFEEDGIRHLLAIYNSFSKD